MDRHLINTHETEQTASSPLAQAGLFSVGTDLSQPRFCSLIPAPCGVRNPKLTQHFQDVSFRLCPASRTKPLPLPFGAWIRSLSVLFSLHSVLETPCPCCLRAGFKFTLFFLTSYSSWGFPGVSMVKNLPVNAGDTGSIPGLGRSPGGGHGNPLQYAYPENSIDRGAWWATVHGVTKSWTGLRD